MAYLYTVPNATTIDATLSQTAGEVTGLVPMILLFVYFTVLLSGSLSQRRRIGRSDTPMWSVIASVTTLLVALIMTLTSGVISLPTLSIVITVTIISGVWFFLNKSRYEV